jgi:hypothetical protein
MPTGLFERHVRYIRRPERRTSRRARCPELPAYRLARLRAELARCDLAGALLSDRIEIRCAPHTRNTCLWTIHAPGRYALVRAAGTLVLFEFVSNLHVSAGATLIDEPNTPRSDFMARDGRHKAVVHRAGEIADVVACTAGANLRVAVDRCGPLGLGALQRLVLE